MLCVCVSVLSLILVDSVLRVLFVLCADEGGFFLTIYWNLPMTHDAPAQGYAQWQLDLLAADLQLCNCDTEQCVPPDPPYPNPGPDHMATVLYVVGAAACVLVVGVFGWWFNRNRREDESEGEERRLVDSSVNETA